MVCGIMHRPLHLILILCLALTGIGLGAARGTVMVAGQAVICTGAGLVVIDHPAAPDRPHVCPDMALSLMAGVPVLPPDLRPVRGRALQDAPQAFRHPGGQDVPAQTARGPPAGMDRPVRPA